MTMQNEEKLCRLCGKNPPLKYDSKGGVCAECIGYKPPISKPLTYTRTGRKIGRNDPCPCGSGRKSKKCCLQN